MNKSVKNLNIMVTGCGGDIGFGVGKILKMSGYGKRLVGTDISDNHGASALFDECVVVPRADAKNYLDVIKKLIKKHKIDLFIPISESELTVLLKAGLLEEIDGVPVICADPNSVSVGLDKLKTVNFLKEANLPFPWTQIVAEGKPKKLPCIIKERSGHGSKNVAIVNKEMVDSFYKTRPKDIWQELLLPDDQEYTCGIFRSKKTSTRIIVFRRKLQGGFTGSGEVVNNPAINRVLTELAIGLSLRGSINVQLRLTNRGPMIFEINPRFSSTVVFRHLLGFRDLTWSINDKLGLERENYIPPKTSTKIYRYSDEIIILPKKNENFH